MPPANRVSTQTTAQRPAPVRCAVGDTLCEVRVLDAAQWQALPPNRRPSVAEYVPGLGWVVALPPGQHVD